MAATLPQIYMLLRSLGLRFSKGQDESIVIQAETKLYKDLDGDKVLLLVIQLLENGEYFQLFCPSAFKLTGPHADVFLKACCIVQWQTKMIQFEYDPRDGEIRPIIEFPLEDGVITARQLSRCINAMTHLIDTYYPVLERARDHGVIDFPADQMATASRVVDSLAGQFPSEVLGEALRRILGMRQRPIVS